MKKNNLNESKDADRKEIIIRTAIKLFHDLGYDNTNTRELSRSSGFSNAGIYYYFKDKEDLLFNILNSTIDRVIQSFKLAIKNDDDPKTNLRRVVRNLLNDIMNYKMESDLLNRESQRLNPRHAKIIKEKINEPFIMVRNEIKRLADKGELKDLDLVSTTFSLLAMPNWAYRWYDPGKSLTIDELTERIIEVFFYGALKK